MDFPSATSTRPAEALGSTSKVPTEPRVGVRRCPRQLRLVESGREGRSPCCRLGTKLKFGPRSAAPQIAGAPGVSPAMSRASKRGLPRQAKALGTNLVQLSCL